MDLKGVISLLDAQSADLAKKLENCGAASAVTRKTLDEADDTSLRRGFDHLLAALPGAIDSGRLLGRMEAAAHLLKVIDARGLEALLAEFERGDHRGPVH